MTREFDAITRTSLNSMGDGMTALLRAKDMADMVEIQFPLARQNLCAIVAGSALLKEAADRAVDERRFVRSGRRGERAAPEIAGDFGVSRVRQGGEKPSGAGEAHQPIAGARHQQNRLRYAGESGIDTAVGGATDIVTAARGVAQDQ